MQFLTELLDIKQTSDLHGLFLVEDLGKLKELGLGRMINAFKQSFSQAGHGSTARLNQTNVGSKLQSRATGIGAKSTIIPLGHVRNWAHVRREIIKHLADPGVAGIMYSVDEKPVALMVLGPQWSINNAKSVIGMAWDFTNVSASDDEIQGTLQSLEYKRKSKDSEKEEEKKEVPVREYQGIAQQMGDAIAFVGNAVAAFGNRMDVTFISPQPDDKGAPRDVKKGAQEKADAEARGSKLVDGSKSAELKMKGDAKTAFAKGQTKPLIAAAKALWKATDVTVDDVKDATVFFTVDGKKKKAKIQ